MIKQIDIPHFRQSIRIAAKAGFLPKILWKECFASHDTRWMYHQWNALTKSKIFKPVVDYGFTESALALSEKGKALAIMLGLDPVNVPPAKNLYHDQELLRFAIFLERNGWITNWMTESEIRLPNRSEKLFTDRTRAPKIPDLVIEWNRPNDKILWAVELERTRKEMYRYYDMVGAYRGISKIDSVLVIVASDSIEANIKTAQGKLNYPQQQRPMIFASFSEVINDPAQCELRIGNSRTTLGNAAVALSNSASVPGGEVGKSEHHTQHQKVVFKKTSLLA